MDAPRRCHAITKAGAPCDVRPKPDSDFCVWHDPNRSAKQLGAKGGMSRSNLARARKLLTREQINNLGDVHEVLLVSFFKVATADLDPEIGKALATMARAIRDVALASRLEDQIAELRALIADASGQKTG